MLSRQTHSKHALLVNLQSRVIKVPLLVLYTSGSNTDPLPPQFHFGLLSPSSEYVYCPACIKTTEWIECPGSAATTTTTTTSFLLAPDYSLDTTVSFFLTDSMIPGTLSGLHLIWLSISSIFVSLLTNGQVSVVFVFYTIIWKVSVNHLLEDGGDFGYVQTIIPKLEMFFFFIPQVSIIYFDYGRADHNTGLRVWRFIFLFLSLDEENLPQS